jgi:hypothetical protein
MLEIDGDPVPQPRDFDAIMNDPELAEDREGAMTTVIPLVGDRNSTTRINVSFDLGLLEAIDAAARERGQTRSAFLATAARRKSSDRSSAVPTRRAAPGAVHQDAASGSAPTDA